MGVNAAIFESGGKRTEHYVPGAYSRSYNITSPGGVSSGNMVILGKSTGGEPMKLLSFGSLADAKKTLVGDELLTAVGYAFNCSNAYTPQKVYAMRVNEGTQSTAMLKSGDNDVLELKSWDWGAHANQLKIWIQSGTAEGSKKISIVYKDESYVVDNIIRQSMEIQYIGDGTSATCSISNGKINLTAMDESSEPADSFEFSFEDYSTLAQLAARINDTDVYVCTVKATDGDEPTAELDTVTSADIMTEKVLCSNLSAIIEAIEDCSLIGSVTLKSEARTVIDNTDGYIYFTEGTIGSYTATEWAKALEVLEAEDIQIISTPSTEDTVQTLISAHCTSMNSTDNRKERTCILGGSIGESDDAGKLKAKGFNSKFVSYVVDSATASNPITGASEKISGAVLGVMLAAMESAMAVNMPLTNKALNVLGFGKTRTITNMGELIQAGIMVCNANPDNQSELVCIRAMTTFQGKNDLISCERSMVREDLYMNRDLRGRFAGKVGLPNDGSTTAIIQTLKDAAREWANSGYIVPSESNENVWNIKVRINGDKIYLDFSRYLTAPTNFVFITAVNQVYTSSVEL